MRKPKWDHRLDEKYIFCTAIGTDIVVGVVLEWHANGGGDRILCGILGGCINCLFRDGFRR